MLTLQIGGSWHLTAASCHCELLPATLPVGMIGPAGPGSLTGDRTALLLSLAIATLQFKSI